MSKCCAFSKYNSVPNEMLPQSVYMFNRFPSKGISSLTVSFLQICGKYTIFLDRSE